ncbi:type IV pilus biogenesis/stability protein PilW [Marinobacteraceae bacterium S3BR75-40.1]
MSGKVYGNPFVGMKYLALCLLFLTLSACVTYTKSAFNREADAEKAEQTYVQLGLAYIREDHPFRAKEHLDRALEINPESAPATAAMGLVLQMQGEPELAEKKFQKATDFDPDYTRGRTFYGAFLYNQGRFEEAYRQFKRASEDTDYGDRSQIFVNLARTATALGRNDEAVTMFRRALETDPTNVTALRGITSALVDQGDFRQARRYYQRLTALIRRVETIQHTPESIWAGIRIARYFDDADQEASLALLLRNLYPQSEELKQYKALTANE